MDFDVAPAIRAALLAAVDREDFGYTEADTSELTTACSRYLDTAYGWNVPPARIFLVADVLSGIAGGFAATIHTLERFVERAPAA
jgi:cystathionine beta-lyase